MPLESLRSFDLLVDAVIATDADGVVVYANEAAHSLIDRAAGEIEGVHVGELISPVDHRLADVLARRNVPGAKPTITRLPGNRCAEVSVSPSPIEDAWAVLVLREAAQPAARGEGHEEVERILRHEQHRLETAIELAKIGAWEVTPRDEKVEWDGHTAALLGIGDMAGRGAPSDMLLRATEGGAEAMAAAIQEAIQIGTPFHVQHAVRLADGTMRHVEQRGAPQPSGHVIGVTIDVTHRVETDRQLAAALINERTARTNAEAASAASHEVATTLQKSLLPAELPRVPGVELSSVYLASSTMPTDVGGDFFDVFPLNRNDWGLVIGDVCGKGPQAAVLTARIRHGIRALAPRMKRTDALVAAVDATLEPDELSNRFCTLVFARFTPLVDGIDVRLTRAGHPAPMVVRAEGGTEEVGVPGPMLGVGDIGGWDERRFRLHLGDAMMMFTDGVTELRSDEGPMFGEERLREALLQVHLEPSVHTALRRLEQTLLRFQAAPRDDIAMMLLRSPALRSQATVPSDSPARVG